MKELYLDIGGTGVQYQISGSDEIKSFSSENKDKDYVLNEISKIANDNNIESIGIATPCSVDTSTGYLHGKSGIKNFGEFNLYNELTELLNNKNTNIVAMNDANAALLGEVTKFKEFKINTAVQVTIGTGIGGALYIGKIIPGANFFAGEFGYVPQQDGGTDVSGLIATMPLVKKFNGKYTNAKQIFENELNSDIVQGWFYNIAHFLVTIQHWIDPEIILLAGGVTKNNSFESHLDKNIDLFLKNNNLNLKPKIRISKLSNPGLEGAKELLKKKI